MSHAHSEADEPVDAELVDTAPVSLELVRRARRSEVMRPLDADQLVESFAAYQALIPKLLVETDYQQTGDGRFKKKSAWRKLAAAFDLDVTLINVKIERDVDGSPLRAEVWARATAPSGRTMEADGYCSVTEARFARTSGRQKLDNDLPATAATRAKNRAISDLLGTGEVSAEEVDAGAAPARDELPWGPKLIGDVERARQASAALQQLVGPMAATVWKGVQERCGYMPRAIADAYIDLAKTLTSIEEASAV